MGLGASRAEEQKRAEEVFPYLEAFDKKLTRNSTGTILQDYVHIPKENWTILDSISEFDMDGPSGVRMCKVFKLFVARNNKEWGISTSFTNSDKNVEVQDFGRWYGSELLLTNGTSILSCDIEGNANPVKFGTLDVRFYGG